MKKRDWINNRLFLPLALLVLLVASKEAYATFQNWQSDAFKSRQLRNNPPSSERQSGAMRNNNATQEEEEAYYKAIAPKNMERDHNYLLENHPLQEDPLPDKQVE